MGKSVRIWIKIMKISILSFTIILGFSGLLLANNADGQILLNNKVSVTIKTGSLNNAVEQLRTASHIGFYYDTDVLKKYTVTGRTYTGKTVAQILSQIIPDKELTFVEGDGSIIIRNLTAAEKAKKADPGHIIGKITDEKGLALPGASIRIVELDRMLSTSAEGDFTIALPPGKYSLSVSFISYQAKTISNIIVTSGQDTRVDVSMQPDVTGLNEVVVTALGIRKNKATLAYSAQKLDGIEVSQSHESNFINALTGKIAGVQITSSSGGVGSSSRIVIRGENSLKNSQPLFVVDGIPIDNSNNKSAADYRIDAGGARHAVDFGNAASDINPDDIESITILKGPNAAALYGSRASNGVVMITTKSGKTAQGISVSLGYSAENPLRLPHFQNEYGQGVNGKFKYVDGKGGGVNDGEDMSWGPKLDNGYQTTQFFSNGVDAPWISAPNNVKNFFETGNTRNAAIAISGHNDRQDYRVSYSNFSQSGIVPHTDFNKNAFTVNGGTKVGEALSFKTALSYIRSTSGNRMSGGYDDNNVIKQFLWGGRQVDFDKLKAYRNADGSIKTWVNWYNSPYFILAENTNAQSKDHLYGNISGRYQIADWLSLTARTGLDFYTDKRYLKRAQGTIDNIDGMYQEDIYMVREMNSDVLLTANRTFFNALTWEASAGGNIMTRRYESNSAQAPKLLIPDFYNLANVNGPLVASNYRERKQINSLFFTTDLAYKNYVYGNFSIRNDWSSTLPASKNSYGYPSVSIGTNIVNYLKVNKDILSGFKLRASIAQAGADAPVYSVKQRYTTFSWNNKVSLSESNTLFNTDLKPERTRSLELGADISLFNNRLGIEATYYDKHTKDQILSVATTSTSGYAQRIINAGDISNKGVEAIITAGIIRKTNGLNWTMIINYNRNSNKVIDLADGLDAIQMGDYRQNELFGVLVQAKKGEALGTIYGRKFQRDPQGNMIYGANGLPLLDANLLPVGNYTPNWVGGLTNNLSYKNLALSFTLDARSGGSIVSGTESVGMRAGTLAGTLPGREEGIIGAGVIRNTDGSYRPNDVRVTAQQYYQSYYTAGSVEGILIDGSYLKLREVKLSYTLPAKWVRNVRANSASLSLIGRNLWIISSKAKNIDPETSLSNDYVQGLEFGQIPSTRSLGLNLNVTF